MTQRERKQGTRQQHSRLDSTRYPLFVLALVLAVRAGSIHPLQQENLQNPQKSKTRASPCGRKRSSLEALHYNQPSPPYLACARPSREPCWWTLTTLRLRATMPLGAPNLVRILTARKKEFHIYSFHMVQPGSGDTFQTSRPQQCTCSSGQVQGRPRDACNRHV